ncbi:serine hydrolase domain-containing protein [Mucilaginibacter pineti]|nr:serine hydrolase [Mucilaginibacter pineti]
MAKSGKMLYEHYFNGFGADSLHDTRSSFKSITSLLIGIAIDRGLIKNVNEKVSNFFPKEKSFATDTLKRRLTIKDLLEMRSGFDCDEWNDGKDCETEMTKTADWVKFSLALPMKNAPGKVWAYTSCDPMIISGIIKKVSGMSIMDFAARYLFTPMGITNYRWTVDPEGQGMTAGSFYILPSDMAKIGSLVLNNGRWKGKQVVSKRWILVSTKATIPIPDFSFVRISRSKNAIPQPTFYGFYWYNENLTLNGQNFPMVIASGNGGQYIIVIKKLDMVVVFTQGNFGTWKAKQAFDILAKFIIPSIGNGSRAN